jgi:hypothetical protein
MAGLNPHKALKKAPRQDFSFAPGLFSSKSAFQKGSVIRNALYFKTD